MLPNNHLEAMQDDSESSLLEKAKLAREISGGKNEIPHKFFGRKI